MYIRDSIRQRLVCSKLANTDHVARIVGNGSSPLIQSRLLLTGSCRYQALTGMVGQKLNNTLKGLNGPAAGARLTARDAAPLVIPIGTTTSSEPKQVQGADNGHAIYVGTFTTNAKDYRDHRTSDALHRPNHQRQLRLQPVFANGGVSHRSKVPHYLLVRFVKQERVEEDGQDSLCAATDRQGTGSGNMEDRETHSIPSLRIENLCDPVY